MKLTRTVGLAVLAGIAAMALSGAAAPVASATTQFCTENVTPCPAGKIVPAGVQINYTQTPGTQKTIKAENANQEALPSITCQKAEVESEIQGNDGVQVLGKVKTSKQLECSVAKMFNCGVEMLQLPYSFSDIYVNQGNGTWTIFAQPGGSQPGQRMICPGIGLDCIFKVKETNNQNGQQAGNLSFTGGNPATITANQVLLKPITPAGGNCLNIKQAFWDASYTVFAPNPLYQSKDQI